MFRRIGYTFAAAAAISCGLAMSAAPVSAQTTGKAGSAAPSVTGRATTERIRFTSPSTVVQMKVEVVSAAGVPVFDVTSRGSVFDWSLKGGDGEQVADGTYVCVVTLKSVNGRLSQRVGSVTFLGGRATLSPDAELTPGQLGAIGPVEEDSRIAVMSEDVPSTTVVSHDGRDGSVTATTGDLTFKTGDVFSGTETERMRIKADGTVDVKGMIQARDGYGFKDGTKLTIDEKGGLRVTSKDGTNSPLAAGTGTINRVAKWAETGGTGTLTDSTITDTGTGNVGIGITTPLYPLHIVSPTFGQLYVSGGSAADFLMFHTAAPVNTRWTGLRSQGGFGKISSFNDNGSYRVESILTWNNTNGYVGLGVQNPQYPLHIDNAGFGQLYVSGGLAADFLMYHTNGPTNAKWTGLRSQGGFGKISSFNDNGTYRIEPLLVWNNATGNVGIGTLSPRASLEVNVLGVSREAARFNAADKTYITIAENGVDRGYLGTFSGAPEDVDMGTYLGNTTGSVHLAIQDVPKLSVTAAGDVGINTTAPAYKLDVSHGGGTGERVQSTAGFSVVDIDAFNGDAALRFMKGGAFRWNLRNDPSNDNFQLFQTGGPGFGSRLEINSATGNITQPVANSGLVKAAAAVTGGASPTVTRSFNNLGPTTVTVTKSGTGGYIVDFGTAVNTRFYAATLGNGPASGAPIGQISTTPAGLTANGVFVYTTDSTGTPVDTLSFYIVVY